MRNCRNNCDLECLQVDDQVRPLNVTQQRSRFQKSARIKGPVDRSKSKSYIQKFGGGAKASYLPQNVVQRLQTIQQDLTSLISICDITSKSKKNDESESRNTTSALEDPEIDTSKRLERTNLCDKFPYMSYTLLAPVKNSEILRSGSIKGTNSDESMLTPAGDLHKPGSAPTPSASIHQSEQVWRPSSGPSRNVVERSGVLKLKASDSICQTLWYDCASNTDCEDLNLTDDSTVKNKYEEKKEKKDSKLPLRTSASKFGAMRREDGKMFAKQNSDSAKTITFSRKVTEDMNSAPGGSRSFSPRKENLTVDPSDLITSTSSTATKTHQILKKDKQAERVAKTLTKLPLTGKQRTPSPEAKKMPTGKCKSSKSIKDDEGANDTTCSPILKPSDRACSRGKQDERFFGDRSDDKKSEREKKSRSPCDNQRTGKTAGDEFTELGVKEPPVITSSSNEKLERLKLSKETALNIAKQLKDKCEELRHSKEEMLEHLQKVEKENKRLSAEIKAAELTNKKLQIKFGELKNESKTKLTEQEIKTKQIEEENGRLKSRISEMMKQHDEELLEKQKEIEHVQRERLHEIRNVLKARDNRKGQIQRLNTEKAELQTKVKELRDLLSKSHSKTEKLEKDNRRLQEIQNHTQDLKKKKDTEEETNRELETIRQNSKDLEEQVKTLRKSVDAFDEVQQKLIKQTMDYQQQMQSGLEEIEKLKSENSKLSKDLENEKDALLIKIKIIEDQQQTIKQLKEKSEEVKNLVKKNQSLERILNIEREEKLELEEAVEHLNRRKEELKKKIRYLENNLLLAPQEVVRDLQKTQVVLHELENQVQAKQKEWEFHLQSLIKQKEKACSVAEFATKKLVLTTNEYQKQTEAYKVLQKLLAENMAMKDKPQREISSKTLSPKTLSPRSLSPKIVSLKPSLTARNKGESSFLNCVPNRPNKINLDGRTEKFQDET